MKKNRLIIIIILLLAFVALYLLLEDRKEVYPLTNTELTQKALQSFAPTTLEVKKRLEIHPFVIKKPLINIDLIEKNFNLDSKPTLFPDSPPTTHLGRQSRINQFTPRVNFERPEILSSLISTAPIVSNDILSVLQKPLYWDNADYLTLGAIGLGTYILTRLDNDLDKHFKKNADVAESDIFKGAELYGRNTTLLYSAIGFNVLGYVISEPELNLIGVELLEGFLVAENLSNLLKYSFGRTRPQVNIGASKYNAFSPVDNSQKSLPSGHTTLAFTLSSVLASHVDNYYLKALVYAPAVLTGAQRVYSNSHWLSDVFLGAAIGYFVGNAIASLHTYDRENNILIIGNARGELEFVIPL